MKKLFGADWAKLIMKIFGLSHIGFAVFGLYLLLYAMLRFILSGYPIRPNTPYAGVMYFIMTILSLVFLEWLLFAGTFLFKDHIRGVRHTNALFSLLILYMVLLLAIAWTNMFGSGPITMSLAAASGTGNLALAPVVLTGYPIVSLITLNLARRKSQNSGPKPT